MDVTAADRIRASEESERRLEHAHAEEYVFDDGFHEAWNEGMRQAAARRKALANDSLTSSLPSNPFKFLTDDVDLRRRGKVEREGERR